MSAGKADIVELTSSKILSFLSKNPSILGVITWGSFETTGYGCINGDLGAIFTIGRVEGVCGLTDGGI